MVPEFMRVLSSNELPKMENVEIIRTGYLIKVSFLFFSFFLKLVFFLYSFFFFVFFLFSFCFLFFFVFFFFFLKLKLFFKQKGAMRKNWTTRYFELRKNTLTYYRSPNEAPKVCILSVF